MAHKTRSRSQFSGRDRNHFTIQAKIEATDEVYPLKNVYNEMKISELKDYMEFATGIPVNMQRISYLDEGDLLDHTDVRSNDIVPGATLLLRVWSQWRELLEAVASNDEEWVFSLGVTHPCEYKTPNSEYMTKRARKAWFEERAFVALSIAAHRGHEKLCTKLIEAGANVNSTSPLGRTALHVAAAQGHGHIVDLLLEKGADIDAEDDEGNSALTIADKFGNKSCERHLFLFRWQQRAKKIRPSREVPLKPHQYFDSKFPVWKEGGQCQLYFQNIVPPEEYEGTSLNSPKKRPHPGIVRRKEYHMGEDIEDDLVQIRISDFDNAEAGEQVQRIGKKLPPINMEKKSEKLRKAYAFYTGDLDLTRNKPPSFQEWLEKIKDKERRDLEVKRRVMELKKQEEEESTDSDSEIEYGRRKRLEEDKAANYESWLAQKEAEKKKNTPSPREAYKKSESPDKKVKATREKSPGALRLYLRSLGKDKAGQPYEDWLIKKELELLGRAKSGEPLFSF